MSANFGDPVGLLTCVALRRFKLLLLSAFGKTPSLTMKRSRRSSPVPFKRLARKEARDQEASHGEAESPSEPERGNPGDDVWQRYEEIKRYEHESILLLLRVITLNLLHYLPCKTKRFNSIKNRNTNQPHTPRELLQISSAQPSNVNR